MGSVLNNLIYLVLGAGGGGGGGGCSKAFLSLVILLISVFQRAHFS